MKPFRWLILAALAALPSLAMAADIDGSTLPLWWGIPFAGILPYFDISSRSIY